jgi:hypothetical protein
MPTSRVIPKKLPSCPGRDSRFTIRHNPDQGNEWWVYYEPPGADRIPADGPHRELVDVVNSLKEAAGNQAGGSFSINEHQQVIARMTSPAAYPGNAIHVIGLLEGTGEVIIYSETITFLGGTLTPLATPAEGAAWTGPLCGMSYTFVAPGNPQPPSSNFDEVFVDINGQRVQLSTAAGHSPYPPPVGPLSEFLAALRRQLPIGGRFRVNEHGRAFTSDENIFIGQVPLNQWFTPLTPLT